MTSGITAIYNGVLKFSKNTTINNIIGVAGVNPADVSPVKLVNVRGQLDFTITSTDNVFTFSFSIQGGTGEYRDDDSQNFYFLTGTNVSCTVTTPQVNRIIVTTPAGDAGGRRYELNFFPYQATPYTIFKTGGVALAANLTVQVLTHRIIQH